MNRAENMQRNQALRPWVEQNGNKPGTAGTEREQSTKSTRALNQRLTAINQPAIEH